MKRSAGSAFESSPVDLLSGLDDLRNFLLANGKMLPKMEEVDISTLIPIVAVVGVQSAGKSALLSAIIGEKLPVSGGRTTNCRIEVRMRFSETPKKTIRIQRNDGTFLVGEQPFGDGIVEQAHGYIENHFAQGQFLEDGMIIVDVQGPGCKNITFVDLPGLVAPKSGSDHSHKIPERFVQMYIERENCFIVHVVSLADGDPAGAISTRFVTNADPQKKRTLTAYTKVDIQGPARVRKAILDFDANGVLTFNRTLDEQIVSEEQELATLVDNDLPFAIGRGIILSHIENYTKKIIDEKRPMLLAVAKAYSKKLANAISDVGRTKENPLSISRKWQRKIETLVDNIFEGKIGFDSFIQKMKNLHARISIILPEEFPIDLKSNEVVDDLERLRGNHLAFTVGCEPLIKEYSKRAVENITPGVFVWIDDFEKDSKSVVESVLTSPEHIEQNCIGAGKKLQAEIVREIDIAVETFRKVVCDFSEEISEHPVLLNHNALAQAVYTQRIRQLLVIQGMRSFEQIQNFVAMKITEQESMIKDMDGEELKVKTEFYWKERMQAFQQIIFSHMSQIFTNIRKTLCEKVSEFSDFALLKEQPEQEIKRKILLQGEELITNIISALQY